MLKTSTAFAVGALFAEPVKAAAPPPTTVTSELIEAARKEGKISYYSALELNVAERLGNTPSVCRKCYVHPELIEAYLDGSMLDTLRKKAEDELSDRLATLRPEEAAVLGLLRTRLARG